MQFLSLVPDGNEPFYFPICFENMSSLSWVVIGFTQNEIHPSSILEWDYIYIGNSLLTYGKRWFHHHFGDFEARVLSFNLSSTFWPIIKEQDKIFCHVVFMLRWTKYGLNKIITLVVFSLLSVNTSKLFIQKERIDRIFPDDGLDL